jgi:DNA-binding GntR family transcriptional regulator
MAQDSTQEGASLSQYIVGILGERIIRGELAPGTRLLEVGLAEELGVSRGPLREALRILEKRRLVRILPRRGAVVAELGREDVINLYEVFTPLCQLLAARTASRWTPETLPPIYAVIERLIERAEAGDADGYYEQTLAFVRACAPVAANPLLEDMIGDFEPPLRRLIYLARRQRGARMPEHLALLRRVMRHVAEREGEAAVAIVAELAQLELQTTLAALPRAAAPALKAEAAPPA